MKKTLNDTDVKILGIEALNNTLGPADALRFLMLLHREPTDYVQISRRIYKDQTLDGVFERARKNWPARNRRPGKARVAGSKRQKAIA